ncbi:MAG: hypothetical protein R2706_00965 [Acidimicrobiales bacterium]
MIEPHGPSAQDNLAEAHRRLARRFHPDWNGDRGLDERKCLADATISLQAAYGVLQDPLYAELIDGRVVSPTYLARLIDWSRPPASDECMFCASSPACEIWSEHQHSFPRQRFSVNGVMCRDCGRSIVRKKQRRTLWSGWWTLRGFASNALLVVQNAKELARLSRLEAPRPSQDRVLGLLEQPLSYGETVWPRALILALLPLLAGVVAAGLL